MRIPTFSTLVTILGLATSAPSEAARIEYHGTRTDGPDGKNMFFGHITDKETYRIHTQKGDSIIRIVEQLNASGVRNYYHGQFHRVTVEDFLQQNPNIKNPNRIRPNQAFTYKSFKAYRGIIDIM